jgi:hypothetical protein
MRDSLKLEDRILHPLFSNLQPVSKQIPTVATASKAFFVILSPFFKAKKAYFAFLSRFFNAKKAYFGPS